MPVGDKCSVSARKDDRICVELGSVGELEARLGEGDGCRTALDLDGSGGKEVCTTLVEPWAKSVDIDSRNIAQTAYRNLQNRK